MMVNGTPVTPLAFADSTSEVTSLSSSSLCRNASACECESCLAMGGRPAAYPVSRKDVELCSEVCEDEWVSEVLFLLCEGIE